MSDTFAYRASPELTNALRTLNDTIQKFHTEVIKLWEDTHPGIVLAWRKQGAEIECVGFRAELGDPVPSGLSANRERSWLIPRRGKSGDPWRNDLVSVNKHPKIGPLLWNFGVEPTIVVIDHSRWYTPGLADTTDCYYLTWGYEHPDPGPHLTRVPLSEYYTDRMYRVPGRTR
jgi:hypothetical protein